MGITYFALTEKKNSRSPKDEVHHEINLFLVRGDM